MKIAISGNCTAPLVGRLLAVMCPDHEIHFLGFDTGGEQAEYDIVFRQPMPEHPATSRPAAANEILFPRVAFGAFHPDLVYVGNAQGAVVESPLTHYHSSLALYGWRKGMTVEQTALLYCEEVYERLAFFKQWPVWERSLLEEGRACGFPLEAFLEAWRRRGRFMYSVNHPVIFVLADLARELARLAHLTVSVDNPEDYMSDILADGPVWPVYPEVGARFGIPGSYAFKVAQGIHTMPVVLDLAQFIAGSFERYARFEADELRCDRLDAPAYRELEQIAPARKRTNGVAVARPRRSPYAGLPPQQFWRNAVEAVAPAELDPAADPPFAIRRDMRVATAGSCFAQHVSRALSRSGYDFYVAEPSPGGDPFSARYGNVYTARQLLQLFDRAYGAFEPADVAWHRPDGRFADPFRPRIEADGFASVAELTASRARHLAAVREMFERLDVLVFTLGLTEAWRAKRDGAVFPLAPGVVAGDADPGAYEFHNFTVAEVAADLDAFLSRLHGVNADAKVVLTVSPVPLIATYEPQHVLVSTTYSKSVLRAAAGEIARSHPHVWYFPSYEIVTGAYSRGAYFESDLRSVTTSGVDHVMRVFLAHCERGAAVHGDGYDAQLAAESRRVMDVNCDEEAIVRG